MIKERKNILHLHFTMDDNPSLDEETKERYRKMFVGVFFQRFILGLWVLAEGIIYPNFDKIKHCIKPVDIPKSLISFMYHQTMELQIHRYSYYVE